MEKSKITKKSRRNARPKKIRETFTAEKTGKPGRPVGTKKIRKFEETKLGFFLKYEAPIEYELIMRSTPLSPHPKPSIHLIETIAIASHNPVFEKNKYFKYLQLYKETGLNVEPKKLTPKRQEYYEKLMANRVRRYIKEQKKSGFSPYALEV